MQAEYGQREIAMWSRAATCQRKNPINGAVTPRYPPSTATEVLTLARLLVALAVIGPVSVCAQPVWQGFGHEFQHTIRGRLWLRWLSVERDNRI